MNIVGDDLAGSARRATDGRRFDLFGRSAYNRYYYAAFLCVRAALKRIDNSWATPTHAAVPELLLGAVRKRVKNKIRLAVNSNQITYSRGKQLYRAVSDAATELSNLLALAREVRRVADYEPEQLVDRQGSVVRLGSCTLESATKWMQRADIEVNKIIRVYVELGLI